MAGKLIVIEGLDGSGKATQTKLLLKKLKKEGYKTAAFDFPQYNKFFGKLVGAYLRGEFGRAEDVNPYFASMLYALDRWTVGKEINQAIKNGKIVLANRYATANFLHQTPKINPPAGGNKAKIKFLNWLNYLEFDFFNIPRPDLVIFLDLPSSFGKKLIKLKDKRTYLNGKKDIHEKSAGHLLAAEKQANYLIKKYHWQKIKCFFGKEILSREKIADNIWLILRKYEIVRNYEI